jgi:hypothetical protein
MEKSLHKTIKLITLIVAIGALAGVGTGLIFFPGNINIVIFCFLIIVYSLLAFLISYTLVHPEKIMIRKAAKYSLVYFPVLLFITVPVLLTQGNMLLIVMTVLILSAFSILALMHIFLYTDAKALTGTIILLVIIIIGLVLKRYRLPFSGVFFSVSLIFFNIGSYIFGIRCLFLAEKNSYFKYLSFLGSWFITISFSGLLFKLMHWPGANPLIDITNFSMVIGTIAVLITLPSSDYIDWPSLHKKILLRILLPWSFIFVMFIMRFLLPEVNSVIWKEDAKKTPPSFEMFDYSIESKNGLKAE